MIGFIGYGHMGGALVRGLLSHGLPAAEVMIATRSPAKLQPLLVEYPDLQLVDMEQIATADFLFLCVRSEDALPVLRNLSTFHGHLISINGGISLAELAAVYSGPITKAMPSLTAEVGRGMMLLCHQAESASNQEVEQLLSSVSTIKMLPEAQFAEAENLTGCSPAFFACFAQLLAEGSALPLEDAEEMITETLIATSELLKERKMSLADLIKEVATVGGITEKGLAVMDTELPTTVKKMFEAMH